MNITSANEAMILMPFKETFCANMDAMTNI